MATTAADILLDTIHDWGVEVIFGLPGDGINGIIFSTLYPLCISVLSWALFLPRRGSRSNAR